MPKISKATEYNWKRLNSDTKEKLTIRANKTLSKKRVVATNYLDYAPACRLLERISILESPVGNIMYSLCTSLLKYHHIDLKQNVVDFISQFKMYEQIYIDIPDDTWSKNNDILGFIYQSLLTEGEKNQTGQYYTNVKVAEYMLGNKFLENGETFLDPCCGSGMFLLSVKTNTPECLYGFDINPIAIMIAGTNLLVKYSCYDFKPNLYCMDFLKKNLFNNTETGIPLKFDNVYTNPPWGADKEGAYINDFYEIKSKERSSMFIVKSLKRLKPNGTFYFILPTSILKIKAHQDIRKYILNNSTIKQIDLYSNKFDGVFTDYFSIRLSAMQTDVQKYIVTSSDDTRLIELSKTHVRTGLFLLQQPTIEEDSIFNKMESKKHDDLKHSKWALGIVTGNNKKKIIKEMHNGLEPIYTGKQVTPLKLQTTSNFILFEPKSFQQCAKEEYFRAPEKLIYRFISKYPIVAYDNKQCLCLNSANILIPQIDSISIKSVAALLNSTLYKYYYSIKFTDIKVLKSNLEELPFPKLTKDQDDALSNIVSIIVNTNYPDKYHCKLDKIVYSIFDISQKEQQYIDSKIKLS